MKRVLLLLTTSMVLAVALAGFLTVAQTNRWTWWGQPAQLPSDTSQANHPPPSGSGSVAVGVWNEHTPGDLTELDAYNQQVGRKPSVLLWDTSWGPITSEGYHEGLTSEFPVTEAQNLHAQGYSQIVTWEPLDYNRGADQPEYALDTILSGDHDAYIRDYAQDVKSAAVPIYIRFAHEMNGDWTPWSAGLNGNTPEKYAEAWRHIRAIFDTEGATNVKWVFSPNCEAPQSDPAYPMANFYPGDYYVDVLALDCYNNAARNNVQWYSMDELLGGGSYASITALSATKPVILAETASVERVSSWDTEHASETKAKWIKDMAAVLPQKYPRIKAVIWFNHDEAGSAGPGEFRIDSSQASLEAYKTYAADPHFQMTLPYSGLQ